MQKFSQKFNAPRVLLFQRCATRKLGAKEKLYAPHVALGEHTAYELFGSTAGIRTQNLPIICRAL